MKHFAFIALLSAFFLSGCETTNIGKKTRTITVRVPAHEYLLRKEVAIPTAPTREGPSIRVSIEHQRAWLYYDGILQSVSATSTGRKGKPTPKGKFRVISKHERHVSSIYNVRMDYFLRLNAMGGLVGLHKGVIPLEPASAGCIRLPAEKAREFFRAARVGTPVWIE